MTIVRIVPVQYPQRARIVAAELHALDRKIAVLRLKEELAPKIRWWRLKRAWARLVEMRKNLKCWLVPYERTCRGEAFVEAATAEDARARVEGGDFDPDRGEEQVDWRAVGAAKEEE